MIRFLVFVNSFRYLKKNFFFFFFGFIINFRNFLKIFLKIGIKEGRKDLNINFYKLFEISKFFILNILQKARDQKKRRQRVKEVKERMINFFLKRNSIL